MSSEIRRAFETALAAMPGALPIAKQNAAFKPVVGAPWLELRILSAPPQGSTLGSGFRRDVGVASLALMYPVNTGTSAVEAMEAQLRKRFKRGTALVVDGIRVLVDRHPDEDPGMPDGVWYRLAVFVPFVADFYGDV